MSKPKCLIVLNGYYDSPAQAHQVRRIAEECQKRGVAAEILRNNKPRLLTSAKFDYDFAIFLDKDIVFAEYLKKNGLRVFNDPKAIATADDKALTAAALSNSGIEMPPTIALPLRYDGVADADFLSEAEQILGVPYVLKAAKGSCGQQVRLVDKFPSIEECSVMGGVVLQKYVQESAGSSIRIIVAGGEVVASARLTNPNGFLSNAAVGGRMTLIDISAEMEAAALKAAHVLGLDFCGLDFFDLDKPLFIEANSILYFERIESLGVNVASKIIMSIMEKCTI
jgi:RimK family alpha-L-glutamate ligase